MIVYGYPYMYYKNYQKCFDFDILWHHDLIADPEKTLRPIFEKVWLWIMTLLILSFQLDLPLDLLPQAREKLQKDSQENTFLSRSALSTLKVSEMTEEVRSKLKIYAKRFQMEEDVSSLY